jgi:hypothetical protein
LFLATCDKIVPAMRQLVTTCPRQSGTQRKKESKNMKKLINSILVAGLFTVCGCNTPLSVSGDYATPQQTISGAVATTTNGVTVSGAYSTTNQTVGGSVTVGK